jgi:hypothetical protein
MIYFVYVLSKADGKSTSDKLQTSQFVCSNTIIRATNLLQARRRWDVNSNLGSQFDTFERVCWA